MFSILIRTIIIYLVLSIMLKMMGKRQIGELEVNELVSTLLISEIASIPISDTATPLLPSILPILFIAALEVVISVVKNKYEPLKRLVEGTPVYIIYKGRLIQEALRENRISINELLSEMRAQGVGDISEIRYGILEQSGKVSLLKSEKKSSMAKSLIIDTHPDEGTLRAEGLSIEWLEAKLKEMQLKTNEIFLMTINEEGKINVIKKEK